MLQALLLSFLFLPSPSPAATPSVIGCPTDTNGYQLAVSYSAGVFTYLLTYHSTRDKFTGKLAKTWRGNNLVVLKASDLRIEISRVETMEIPGTDIWVSYQVHDEDEVRVECRKGPRFKTLFQR